MTSAKIIGPTPDISSHRYDALPAVPAHASPLRWQSDGSGAIQLGPSRVHQRRTSRGLHDRDLFQTATGHVLVEDEALVGGGTVRQLDDKHLHLSPFV